MDGRVCQHCKASLEGRALDAKFCGIGCKVRAKDGRRRARRRVAYRAGRSCGQCGCAMPETLRASALFCSAKCREAAKNERRRIENFYLPKAMNGPFPAKTCPICRADFEARDWRKTYCGKRSCYQAARRLTGKPYEDALRYRLSIIGHEAVLASGRKWRRTRAADLRTKEALTAIPAIMAMIEKENRRENQ